MFTFLLTILLCGSPAMEIQVQDVDSSYIESVLERDSESFPDHQYVLVVGKESGTRFEFQGNSAQDVVRSMNLFCAEARTGDNAPLGEWMLSCVQ